MKIPFKYLPGSWGLKGKTRERAEAEYNYEGYDLEIKLADIDHRNDPVARQLAHLKAKFEYMHLSRRDYEFQCIEHTMPNGPDKSVELLKIRLKHLELSNYEYEVAVANVTLTGDALKCELLRLQWQNEEITELEYRVAVTKIMVAEGEDQELELNEIYRDLGVITDAQFKNNEATIRKQPYVAVVNSTYDPSEGTGGFAFEFDWNDLWIEELKSNGYQGFTDDQIVQRWFEDVCRGVAETEMDDDGQPVPFNSNGRSINRVRRDGGPTEYS